jgi:hypothetical protein
MALPDELENEAKKAEALNHKADLDRQIRNLGEQINKAGHEMSDQIKKAQDTGSETKTG